MALGGNYNNNKRPTATVYGGISFANTKGVVMSSKLNYEYCMNGTLKISVSPMKEGNGDSISWDYDNQVSIYMSVTAAMNMVKTMEMYKADPDNFRSLGVNSGNGYIGVDSGKIYGANGPCIVLKRFNEAGLESSILYEMKGSDHYFAIANMAKDSLDYDSIPLEGTELDILETIFKEFVNGQTGGQAYAYINHMDAQRFSPRNIAEALGVSGSKSGYSKGGSVFNKSGNSNNGGSSNFQNASADDLESEFM